MTTPATIAPINPTALDVHPGAIWRNLRTVDFALLDHIAYLARQTARSSPSNAHYCTPGRAWLAKRLAVSIRTVSRHTSRLKALGLLDRRQRRPIGGKWQTNLYALKGRATWLVARSMRGFHATPNRGTVEAHKTPSEGRIDARGDNRSALRAIIRSLEQKLRGG